MAGQIPGEFFWFTLPIIALIVVFLIIHFQLLSRLAGKFGELMIPLTRIEEHTKGIDDLRKSIDDLRISKASSHSVSIPMKKLGLEAIVETLDVSLQESRFRIRLPPEVVLRSVINRELMERREIGNFIVGSSFFEFVLRAHPEKCATVIWDVLTKLDPELADAIEWKQTIEKNLILESKGKPA